MTLQAKTTLLITTSIARQSLAYWVNENQKVFSFWEDVGYVAKEEGEGGAGEVAEADVKGAVVGMVVVGVVAAISGPLAPATAVATAVGIAAAASVTKALE